MYNRYITISEATFKDMLTARSKLRDIEIYVDCNQSMLAKQQVLGPLRRILDSRRYAEDVDREMDAAWEAET
jgi:hypothetical protein